MEIFVYSQQIQVSFEFHSLLKGIAVKNLALGPMQVWPLVFSADV